MNQKRTGKQFGRKNYGMICLAAIMAAILITGSVMILNKNNSLNQKYNSALRQLDDGYYQNAFDLFYDLGNYKDSESYATYCSGIISGDKGYYSDAVEKLGSLSGFADSDRAAAYFAARKAEKTAESIEEISAVIDLYDSTEEFSDSAERADNLKEKLSRITPEPTPKPTAVQTPEPTSKPTAVQTPEPTPKPTAVQTPEPTPKPTAVPTPTPNPTAVQTSEPTSWLTDEQVAQMNAQSGEGSQTEQAAEPTAALTFAPTPADVSAAAPTIVPIAEPSEVPTVKATQESEVTQKPEITAAAASVKNSESENTPEPTATEAPKASVQGIVIDTDNLNIHRTADRTSDVLGGVGKGKTVQIESLLNGWAKITTEQGMTGFVSADYLSFDQMAFIDAENAGKAIVNAKPVLYVRESPDAHSGVIRSIPNKTEVIVLETTDNGWTKISLYGYTGYVSSNYLRAVE